MPQPSRRASRFMIMTTASLIGLGAAMGPGPAFAVSAESQEYLTEAQAALKKGDANAAVIQLKNAIKSDPDNVEARILLGQYALRRGDAPGAEKEFREARKRGASEDKVVMPLAQAYLLQNKNKELLAEILTDKLTGDTKVIAHTMRARALIADNKMDKAQAELDIARPDAGKLESFFLAQGELYLRQRKPAEAEKEIDRAIEINPNFAPALNQKGDLRRVQKDLDGAVTAYSAALALEENFIPARLSRSIAYLGQQKFAEAEADADIMIKRLPEMPMARYVKAVVQAQRKDVAPALETLAPVEFRLADFMPAVYLLASLNLQQNQLEGAARYAERYQASNRDSVDAAKLLASVYTRQKRSAEALELLKPLEKTASADTGFLALLGNAYLANNDFTNSARVFKELQKLSPENEAVREQLAITSLGMGEKGQAVEELEALTAGAGGSDRANLLLIMTQMRAREFDKALVAAENYAKRNEKSGMAQNLIGSVYLAKNSKPEARIAFEKALEVEPNFTAPRMNLAQLERSEGKIDAAKAQLEKVLEINKGDERALLLLAEIAAAEKDTETAASLLQRAADENPKSQTARIQLIEMHLQRENPSAALKVAGELLAIEPNAPVALNAMAQVQIANKQLPSAISTYRRMTALMPKSAPAHLMLGRTLSMNNNIEEAKASFDDAIKAEPDFFTAHEERVRLELKTGGGTAAEKLAAKFRDEMPTNPDAHKLLADVYFANENFPKAIESYEKAQSIKPTSKVNQLLYGALYRNGDIVAATEKLRKWAKENPEDWQTRLFFSTELIRQGESKEAISENEALNEKFPGNPLILNNLGWLLMRNGDKRGVELAGTAYKLAPDSPEIQDTYGWMLAQEGKTGEAIPILRKAAEKLPKNAEISYHLAVALEKDGKTEEALKVLQKLLSTGSKFDERPDAQKLYEKLKPAG